MRKLSGAHAAPIQIPQRLKKIFQTVYFDFINHSQHITQMSRRKSFLGKPNHIRLREIDQKPPFILAERHPHFGQFQQNRRIRLALIFFVHLILSGGRHCACRILQLKGPWATLRGCIFRPGHRKFQPSPARLVPSNPGLVEIEPSVLMVSSAEVEEQISRI